MNLLLPVFQLLYFIIHFLFSLCQAVIDCFNELYHFFTRILFWKNHYKPCYGQILQDASRLKKIPQHLAIIFVQVSNINLEFVQYLLQWCIGFGIHNISLYDSEGVLKSKLPSLLDKISHIHSDLLVKVYIDGQVFARKCNCLTNQQMKRRNINPIKTDLEKFKIRINLLCIEDGKEDIVRVAKEAFSDLKMDSTHISKCLITNTVVDPDLCIIIGRPICTYGFLPWQIRLTEFLNFPSLSQLDYFEFRKLLRIYSKCQQRLGY